MSEVTPKYLSKITLLDGTVLEIKDAAARQAIQGGTHFVGVTTTALTDGSSTQTVTIAGNSYTAMNGDIVAYSNKEFIWADVDTKWHELGDLTNLGALALKDSASATYTPAGSVSFSGESLTSTGTFTPAGSVSFSGESTTSTGTFTPAGTVSKPDIDVTPTTASIAEFASAGSVTNGTAASCTLPTMSTTYNESTENLVFGFTAGSFTANTPTSVTLPTSKNTTVMTGASAELHATPTFTGTEGSVSVSGTPAGSASFTGTEGSVSVSGTPAGSASFTGTEATITVS